MSALPIILIPADRRLKGAHPFHLAGEKYLQALHEVSGVLPLVVPALPGQPLPVGELLGQVDGLLLTGSVSNVNPERYGQSLAEDRLLLDQERDHLSLELIDAALALGVPLFGICRGLQELNVALGGSLHQRVHDVPGMMDHREDPAADVAIQYGPAHDVLFEPQGMLRGWLGGAAGARVNSLHGQGIARLADRLRIEARAPDGLVEAVSVAEAVAFAFAVQWHPEWQAQSDNVSRALFEQFGAAARARQRIRLRQANPDG